MYYSVKPYVWLRGTIPKLYIVTNIKEQIEQCYELNNVTYEDLKTLANDVLKVTSDEGKFALKIYNPNSRTKDEVAWEIELTLHLIKNNVPVIKPVAGKQGYVSTFNIDGKERTVVLSEWAAGEKPAPSEETYFLIGKAAAKIHEAAETFNQPTTREIYDVEYLIDHQLLLIQDVLNEVNLWQEVKDLTDRLKQHLKKLKLDIGICHIDLTLDNVHIADGKVIIFDFDSAAVCWRAYEAWGVLKTAQWRFDAWLKGYRTIRSFSRDDEKAVACFAIIGDIANTVWKLGFAKSSRGEPLLKTSELPSVVDEWLN